MKGTGHYSNSKNQNKSLHWFKFVLTIIHGFDQRVRKENRVHVLFSLSQNALRGVLQFNVE